MPPTKTAKRPLDTAEEPPEAKAPKTTEAYNFLTPKEVTEADRASIASALGAKTSLSNEDLVAMKLSVDPTQKKITFGRGFDNMVKFFGPVSVFGPDGGGTYPDVKQIKAMVGISEDDYARFTKFVVDGFAANKDAIAKMFAPGPEKKEFLKDPEAWTRRAIGDGTINLPVKRTEKYNEDGSIDRVNITLGAKSKITRKGADTNAETNAALAGRLFGPEVEDHVRAEQGLGKRMYMPPMNDALGAPIDPESLFKGGRFKALAVLDMAISHLFVIEAKSQRVPHFSTVAMWNGMTGIRIIETGASAAPAMTDADRIKLAALL